MAPATVKLFVGRLPQSVRETELCAAFAAYGAPEARVLVDSISGRSRGFGFLHFARAEDAEAALATPHVVAGRLLVLERQRSDLVQSVAAEHEAAEDAASVAAAASLLALSRLAEPVAAELSRKPRRRNPDLASALASADASMSGTDTASSVAHDAATTSASADETATSNRVYVINLPAVGAPSWHALRAHMRSFGFAQWSREEVDVASGIRHAVFAFKKAAAAAAALAIATHAVEGISLRVVAEADAPSSALAMLLAAPASAPVPRVEIAPLPPSPLPAEAASPNVSYPARAAARVSTVPEAARLSAVAALSAAEMDLQLEDGADISSGAPGGRLLLASSTRESFEVLFATHGPRTAVAALLEAASPTAARARGLVAPSPTLPLSVRLLRLSRYLRRKQLPPVARLDVPRLSDVKAAAVADKGDADGTALVRSLKRDCHERLLKLWQQVAPRAARERAAATARTRRVSSSPPHSASPSHERSPAPRRLESLLRRQASALASDESSGGSGTDSESERAPPRDMARAGAGHDDDSDADIPSDGGSGSDSDERLISQRPPRLAAPPPSSRSAAALFRRQAMPTARESAARELDRRLR